MVQPVNTNGAINPGIPAGSVEVREALLQGQHLSKLTVDKPSSLWNARASLRDKGIPLNTEMIDSVEYTYVPGAPNVQLTQKFRRKQRKGKAAPAKRTAKAAPVRQAASVAHRMEVGSVKAALELRASGKVRVVVEWVDGLMDFEVPNG